MIYLIDSNFGVVCPFVTILKLIQEGHDEMADSARKKTSTSKRSKNTGKTTKTNTRANNKRDSVRDSALYHEIWLIVLFVILLFLFLCNFGIMGKVGATLSGFMFGCFGFTAYFFPVLFFIAIAFWFANEGMPGVIRKLVAGIVLFLMVGVICDLISGNSAELKEYAVKDIYRLSSEKHNGGGFFAGSISYCFRYYLETIGTVLLVILFSVISLIILTEKSFLSAMRDGGHKVREISREEAERRREAADRRRAENEVRRQEQEEQRRKREEEKRIQEEAAESEKLLRREKKVTGVMLNPTITKQEGKKTDDMHEISYTDEPAAQVSSHPVPDPSAMDFEKIRINSRHQLAEEEFEEEIPVGITEVKPTPVYDEGFTFAEEEPVKKPAAAVRPVAAPVRESVPDHSNSNIRIHKEGIEEQPAAQPVSHERPKIVPPVSEMQKEVAHAEKKVPQKYMFPPLSRLTKGEAKTSDNSNELKDTALRLQQTLNTFGVKVTITDISQGPSVTRYELQPEQGVKVSKIVGLADDIKLNLAATDIRIEAPIPGKAAIGIEVPNKENSAVALRDLLESNEFKSFESNIAFAVGKDIAGKTVVTDIAKMPHMLIAGATGSGKSVCINTLIMSILYKAHPDDVKLIMIDPKVVELSVYNGIPHLLIPVVTDPKKASAALHWGVSEMEDRYRKFADFNVRDLKGYNKKIESMQESGEENCPPKMPQIVIIVDELADLMMVCPGEVEESICRLAQLARAAGIHLIIATQRPSVDVITGLIKANMPSRVAFSVSSGVDSRTILDMNGAEKLLGKGDMLFYPQGYTKPARIQGAFVSDKEVSDVVDFLKNQTLGNTYSEDIEEKMKSFGSGQAGASGGGSDSNDSALDDLFEKAGRFIIEKDKASIGMLQRMFKIGFNRAARIMDQLCEYGVVGEEEGTKPRKILMSPEQFEQLMEEIG